MAITESTAQADTRSVCIVNLLRFIRLPRL